MEKMFEIPVRPVRIAFDHWKLHERYEEAVRTAVRHGHTSLSIMFCIISRINHWNCIGDLS